MMRNRVVAMAQSWLGCNEADGSHRQIIDIYNTIQPLPGNYKLSYTDPWCAGFVSAVAKKCGCTNIVFPECSCDRMIALFKKAGRWEENDAYTPQPGDIIFYDWGDSGFGDNTGGSDHVGIVVSVSSGSIRVIEGNISDKVGYRTITVNGRYIRGYGLPDYENTTPVAKDQPVSTISNKTTSVSVRTLAKGMTGEDVKSLQRLLIGRRFSVGEDGADGDFGNNTLNAVKLFQASAKLTDDGIVGAKTWEALING